VIVDVNVNLSRWPFRRLAGDEPRDLVARLSKASIIEAWAGSFDGVFHKDVAGANARLAADCRTHGRGMLRPFGSINPKLSDWREDLRRCQEEHKMPGIRLHPNYHGYKLDDPAFRELLTAAAERKLVVQLALCMEDERTQHPLMRVSPVDLRPLPEAMRVQPRPRLVILNCYPQLRPDALRPLLGIEGIAFELSMIERISAVRRLADEVSFSRVLFGSHAPLFYLESALLKVKEAGLTEAENKAVCIENARKLLPG
jgi:predicted TIM-barrel fold metal-dependent hydrolase